MNQEDSIQAQPAATSDRRRNRRLEPPYITDEGFVLVDRRGSREERSAAKPAAPGSLEAELEALMFA